MICEHSKEIPQSIYCTEILVHYFHELIGNTLQFNLTIYLFSHFIKY